MNYSNNSEAKKLLKSTSNKLNLIDQSFFDQYHQNSNVTTKKIKNAKYKKLMQIPNLAQFIKPKVKTKKPIKKMTYAIYKKEKKLLRKCKSRKSKLKKCILKYRLSNRKKALDKDIKKVENNNKIVETCERLKDLTLEVTSKYVLRSKKINEATNSKHEMNRCDVPMEICDNLKSLNLEPTKCGVLHSRRFREYCDNTTSKELCNLIDSLLRELNRFQIRAFQENIYKKKSRRRFVIGLREVQVQMKIHKIKCVIIATDCEKCDAEGGLDQIIFDIKAECEKDSIPCVFALQRRQLSYALFKKTPISCVGILDYAGANDIFFKMLNVLEVEKNNYKQLKSK